MSGDQMIRDRALDRAIRYAKGALEALAEAKVARERNSSDDGKWLTDFASEQLVLALHRLNHDVPMPVSSEMD